MTTMQQRHAEGLDFDPLELPRAPVIIESVALTKWARRQRSRYMRRVIEAGIGRLLAYWAPRPRDAGERQIRSPVLAAR